MNKVVVIGGGQAGLQVCESLRREGFEGELCLVSNEKILPYQRPPLSKSFLLGEVEAERLLIRPGSFFEKHKINCKLGSAAVSIERQKKVVVLASGEILPYDTLVLATGSKVKKLSDGQRDSRIFYVRSLLDAEGLAERLGDFKSVAVIGGGFIGLEVAAVCRVLSKSVIVFEQSDSLMARVIPPPLAAFYEDVHTKKGVKIKLSATIENIATDRDSIIISSGNKESSVDALVVGIGVIPNISLATKSAIKCHDGILTDATGRTNDDHIFAAGDCAAFFSNYHKSHVRLESVQHAVDTGKVVAANILDNDKEYDSVPWFWSDQYDLKLQIAGLLDPHTDVFTLGSIEEESFSMFYFTEGIHTGTASVNRPSDHMKSRKLLGSGSKLTKRIMEKEGFDLTAFAKEHL